MLYIILAGTDGQIAPERELNLALRCGIDQIAVARVEEGINRLGERFLARLFTPGERADCADHPARLAARFAAKEAVAKALGTGIGDVGWQEIEIRTGERGRPVLTLHGNAARLAAELGLREWDISLTHTADLAAAVAVAAG
ncbi:MAG: holo-ACP synthase [Anaerolineae bacterium]|nr:holo-ACP synthase [Anaerolineae bacterium]